MNDHTSTSWPTGEPSSGLGNYWQPGRDLSRAIQAMPADLESRLTWQLYLETHGHHDGHPAPRESAPLSASYLATAIGKKLVSRGRDERGERIANQAPKPVRNAIKRLVAEGVWEVVNEWNQVLGAPPEYRLNKDARYWGDLTPHYLRVEDATAPEDDAPDAASADEAEDVTRYTRVTQRETTWGQNDPTLGSEQPHPWVGATPPPGSEEPHPWGRSDPQVKSKNKDEVEEVEALPGGGDLESSEHEDITSRHLAWLREVQNAERAGEILL